MIELQGPTKEMIDLTEEEERPWLDGYEVKHLEDYDASKEIYTGIGNGTVITFDNAEELKKKLKRREIDSFITITPKYNDAYFPDNRAEYEKTGYQRIYWGEISRLYCLVPKSMAIYNLKNISVKTAAK